MMDITHGAFIGLDKNFRSYDSVITGKPTRPSELLISIDKELVESGVNRVELTDKTVSMKIDEDYLNTKDSKEIAEIIKNTFKNGVHCISEHISYSTMEPEFPPVLTKSHIVVIRGEK